MTKKELKNALDFVFELKERGFTLQQLKDVYYPVCILKYDFTLSELIDFGYSLKELTSETLTLNALKKSKYTCKRINQTINTKFASYHEAGHIIVILSYPEYCEFVKATIIPTKNASGYCKYKYNKFNWLITALISFGGVSAEKLLFKKNKISKNQIGMSASSDYNTIQSLLKKNSIEPRRDYDMLCKGCQKLIELNEIVLNKIAQQLFIKKTLFKSDIQNILKKYPLKMS